MLLNQLELGAVIAPADFQHAKPLCRKLGDRVYEVCPGIAGYAYEFGLDLHLENTQWLSWPTLPGNASIPEPMPLKNSSLFNSFAQLRYDPGDYLEFAQAHGPFFNLDGTSYYGGANYLEMAVTQFIIRWYLRLDNDHAPSFVAAHFRRLEFLRCHLRVPLRATAGNSVHVTVDPLSIDKTHPIRDPKTILFDLAMRGICSTDGRPILSSLQSVVAVQALQWGRELGPVDRICPYCKEKISGGRSDKKACSKSCRTALNHQRSRRRKKGWSF